MAEISKSKQTQDAYCQAKPQMVSFGCQVNEHKELPDVNLPFFREKEVSANKLSESWSSGSSFDC
jgi:hypothetical protein